MNIDPEKQEELLNFSNDPDYEVKMAKKMNKKKNKADKLIEDYSTKARKATGLEDVEEHEKISTLANIVSRQKEKKNKEEADFDEFEELFQDDDEKDVVQKGLDYLPDDESDDETGGQQAPGQKDTGGNLNRKDTHLNEDGNQMLKIIKKENRMEEGESEMDQSVSMNESDYSDESDEEEQENAGPSTFSKVSVYIILKL